MANENPGSFVIKGAGQAVLRENGIVVAQLFRLGDMKVSLDYPSTDIYGGPGFYPFDSADGDRSIKISFTNNEYDLSYLKATAGANVQDNKSIAIPKLGEIITVPTQTPYTVNLQEKDRFVALSETVRYATSKIPLERAETAAAGKYTCSAGVLTFDASDAGKMLIADYEFTMTAARVAEFGNNDSLPVVEIMHDGRFRHPTAGLMGVATRFYSCKAGGKTDIDWKRASGSTHGLEFGVLDTRGDGKLGYLAEYLLSA